MKGPPTAVLLQLCNDMSSTIEEVLISQLSTHSGTHAVDDNMFCLQVWQDYQALVVWSGTFP